jgi:hypothetical protein
MISVSIEEGKMKRAAILLLFACGLFAVAAMAEEAEKVNVNGEWTMTTTSSRGERTSTIVFVQEGEELTVTTTTRRGESKGTGTLKGNVIEWTITSKSDRGTWTRTYTGTVDGDTMAGEAKRGDNASPWKAVREQAEADA